MADESGVAGLLIAMLIAVIAFTAIEVILNGNIFPAGFKERPRGQANFSRVRNALQAYAQANGRLPCPMAAAQIGTGTAGQEAATCNANAVARGIVPWKTINLPEADVLDGFKNHFLTYDVAAVAATHTCPGALPPVPASVAANTSYIMTSSTAATPTTGETTNRYIAAIVSHGENGLGSLNQGGGTASAPTSAVEQQNVSTLTSQVIAKPAANLDTSSSTYFDDTVYLIEYGVGKGQFKLCVDDGATATATSGQQADLNAVLTGTGSLGRSLSGSVNVTRRDGATDTAKVTITGSGNIFGGGGGYGIGDANVDFGENLTIAIGRHWDHFSLAAIPTGTSGHNEISVSGYDGDHLVGTRILADSTTSQTNTFGSLGFGGAYFNTLVLTPVRSDGAFSLVNVRVCYFVFPCAVTPNSHPVEMATAFYSDGTPRVRLTTRPSGTTSADTSPIGANDATMTSAGGVMGLGYGTTFAVSDGATTLVSFSNAVIGAVTNATAVGGDIYFYDSNNLHLYSSRRSTTTAYQPTGITDGSASTLFSCGGHQLWAVYDAIFFEAKTPVGATTCDLYRMRADESTATLVPLPTADMHEGVGGDANQFFVGANKLYVTARNASIGYELFRFDPLQDVTDYESYDLTVGASDTAFDFATYLCVVKAFGTDWGVI